MGREAGSTKCNCGNLEYEIIKKLIGPIAPTGDSQFDETRHKNMMATCDLIEQLIDDVKDIYLLYKDSHESSVANIADYAGTSLEGIKYILDEVFNANNNNH